MHTRTHLHTRTYVPTLPASVRENKATMRCCIGMFVAPYAIVYAYFYASNLIKDRNAYFTIISKINVQAT